MSWFTRLMSLFGEYVEDADMKCIGYGDKAGKCKAEAGTPWSPYWCRECDEKRRQAITKQLDAIMEKMK